MKKIFIIGTIVASLLFLLYILIWNSIIKKSDVSIGAEWLGRKVSMQITNIMSDDKDHRFVKSDFNSVDQEFLNRSYCKYTFVFRDGLVMSSLKDDDIIAALVPTVGYPRFSIGKITADCLMLKKSSAVQICKIEDLPLVISE